MVTGVAPSYRGGASVVQSLSVGSWRIGLWDSLIANRTRGHRLWANVGGVDRSVEVGRGRLAVHLIECNTKRISGPGSRNDGAVDELAARSSQIG
jgi:hypothetical protein